MVVKVPDGQKHCTSVVQTFIATAMQIYHEYHTAISTDLRQLCPRSLESHQRPFIVNYPEKM